MSVSAGSTVATSPPRTYEDLWQDYAAGDLSTVTLRWLLDHDEVFKAWCVKRAAAERNKRDQAAQEDDGA